jgi:hypothetical protein
MIGEEGALSSTLTVGPLELGNGAEAAATGEVTAAAGAGTPRSAAAAEGSAFAAADEADEVEADAAT